MADYSKSCLQILDAVGGKENIISVSHCATRLRLVLKDKKKYDAETIDKIDGVQGLFFNTGQLQIIFGLGVVDVYKAFVQVTGVKGLSLQEVKESQKNQGNIFMRILKSIPGAIMPMIPVLIGCALITAFATILRITLDKGFNIVITQNPWYLLFSNMGSLASGYLIIYICINCAKNWGMNVPTAMAIGLFLCLAGNGATLIPGWAKFLKYTASIFTGMITIWLGAKIENSLKKKINDNFQMFIIPLVSILISCTFAILFFGPIMTWIEKGLEWIILNGLQNKNLYGFGLGLLGLVMGPLIVTGIHQVLIPIGTRQYTVNPGYNTLYISMLCNNIAQGAAALAVATRSKEKKIKALGFSTGIVALLGITEPAMFGVNLRNKRVFYSAMFGAFVGSWYGAAMNVAITVYGGGSPSLLTILFSTPLESISQVEVDKLIGPSKVILGETPLNQWFDLADGSGKIFLQGRYSANGVEIGWMNMINMVISVVITIVVTYLCTFFSYKDNTNVKKTSWLSIKLTPIKIWFNKLNSSYKASNFAKWCNNISIKIKLVLDKKERINYEYPKMKKLAKINSPIDGKFIELREVPDPIFSSGTMGEGFAINPTRGVVYAPFNGEVTMIFDTKHAIGLKSNDGIEILIHIGLDTVKLNGAPFKTKVKVGDKFKVGQNLMTFDIKMIKQANLSAITPVVITSKGNFRNFTINKDNQKVNYVNTIINFN